MSRRLTYFDANISQYRLLPFVSIEEARQVNSTLTHDCITKAVSDIARVTSLGDAASISDLEAIRRYKALGERGEERLEIYTHHRFDLLPMGQRFSTDDIALIQSLGRREDVYLPETFSEYFAWVRKRAGLSQKVATKIMGLPNSSVARYESGEALPTITTMQRFPALAQKAGIPFNDIKQEYISARFGPDTGTLSAIIEREKWFAQMSTKELAKKANVRTTMIRGIEKIQGIPLFVTLESIAWALESPRIMAIAKELKHEFNKRADRACDKRSQSVSETGTICTAARRVQTATPGFF